MQRILVIGSPGSGKSTLARRLARRLGLPLVHLDQEFFRPNWVEPPRAEWRERVRRLAAQPRWVMDGDYFATMDLRLPRATAIVWLDIGRLRCLANVFRRVVRHYGHVRPDLGPGCIERFNGPFVRWIWQYPHRVRPGIMRMLEQVGPEQRSFVLRSWAEIPSVEHRLALGQESA